MKKLIYFLILILIVWACQDKIVPVKSRYTPVNVGSAPNDGTGDNLRAAFQKVNAGFVDVYDSLGHIYTETQTKKVINDSLNGRVADALLLNDYALLSTDTNTYGGAITKNYFDTYNLAGTGGKFYVLSGNIDSLGFPATNDTSITHTNFIGKHVTIYREGSLQQQHFNNTEQDGFWFNSVTGEVRVRPAFTGGEQIEIWVTNTIEWESLIAEGEGGDPPATSDLLDSLLAYYDLDELSGVIVNDSRGDNDGTTTATINQAGKLGRSELFANPNAITIPYDASLIPQADEFTISLWFKLTQMPSTAGRAMFLFAYNNSAEPYQPIYISLESDVDNYVAFRLTNSTGTEFAYETDQSSVPYTTGSWYHVVCVNEGNGVNAKIYVNGVNVSSYSSAVFTGTIASFNTNISIGNIANGYNYAVVGNVDEIAIFDEALTSAQVTELYNSGAGLTYPFN